MFRKLFLAITVGILAIVCNAREFPLCAYGASTPEKVSIAKKAGFTCFTGGGKDYRALVTAAKKHGMKTVFSPGNVIGSDMEKEAQDWPMLAWYLVDEPDVQKWSRERVQQAHERAKKAFPNHQTTLVIGQGITLIPYYDLPDIMMVDWYPVPHLKLTSFGDNVRYTKEGMAKRGCAENPLWGVVQMFDWKDFKQHRPDNDRIGRFPTEEEMRFMSYHGILNGATGLFYFTMSPKGKLTAQEYPERWKRVANVVKELHELLPVLENGIIVENPVPVTAPLMMQSRAYKGKIYMIFLNASDEEQTVPPALLEKYYKEMFGRKKAPKISPYGVWVLKYS